MISFRGNYVIHDRQGGHSSGKPGKVRENGKSLGKVRGD